MFGLGNIFKKKVKVVTRDIATFAKKDLAEAMIGVAVLTMYADDKVDDSERKKTQAVLQNNPALREFPQLIAETMQRFETLCRDVGLTQARVQILRELEGVNGDRHEAEDVLLGGLSVALADGEMSEPEEKILKQVAQRLSLNLDDYLS